MRLDALPASALERKSGASGRGARGHAGHGRRDTVVSRASARSGYFHKDCGGSTASPGGDLAQGAAGSLSLSLPDRYCTADGGREWASEITLADLTAALAAHGLAAPGWQSLTVARRGESGRAVTLRLDATEIQAEEFRLAVGESLGWNRIPSTWFEVSRQGDRFVFHGRGWGHGVGLCQKGAAAMAAQGRAPRADSGAVFSRDGSRADEESGRGVAELCRQRVRSRIAGCRRTRHLCRN